MGSGDLLTFNLLLISGTFDDFVLKLTLQSWFRCRQRSVKHARRSETSRQRSYLLSSPCPETAPAAPPSAGLAALQGSNSISRP